jgi:NitT/TauT family transport system ATP-binding protein
MITVINLEKRYGDGAHEVQALEPTSFTIKPGEFVSFVGPSGCGKTTCLFMLAGLEQPTLGRILVDGVRVFGPGNDRGMVFQNYTLYPWLSVRENICFSLKLKVNRNSIGADEAVEHRIEALLHLMGLEEFADALPRQLSGGMQQRVAIARALLPKPDVLLMDEPFGALDAQTREEMQDLLLTINRVERTTTVFVTHDVDEAIYLSNRVLVFSPRPGKIVADLDIPFGAERSADLKVDPVFIGLKQTVKQLLNKNVQRNRESHLEQLTQSRVAESQEKSI